MKFIVSCRSKIYTAADMKEGWSNRQAMSCLHSYRLHIHSTLASGDIMDQKHYTIKLSPTKYKSQVKWLLTSLLPAAAHPPNSTSIEIKFLEAHVNCSNNHKLFHIHERLHWTSCRTRIMRIMRARGAASTTCQPQGQCIEESHGETAAASIKFWLRHLLTHAPHSVSWCCHTQNASKEIEDRNYLWMDINNGYCSTG